MPLNCDIISVYHGLSYLIRPTDGENSFKGGRMIVGAQCEVSLIIVTLQSFKISFNMNINGFLLGKYMNAVNISKISKYLLSTLEIQNSYCDDLLI